MPAPLPEGIYPLLVCPRDRAALRRHDKGGPLICTSCGVSFPIHRGVPVLLNEEASLFSITSIIDQERNARQSTAAQRAAAMLRAWMPNPSATISAKNIAHLVRLVLERTASPKVLIVGSGETGNGMRCLLDDSRIQVVESDVYFSSRVNLIADAHDLPFQDASFEAVVCQAVLEYLPEPQRCVCEIYRVLKANGLAYAETPFMQEVHGGSHDFQRFTLLGHRRLFRHFEQISAGVVCGPGMALAWSVGYFLRSFSRSRIWRGAVRAFAQIATFWLYYCDYWLAGKPIASDAASAVFFLGRKSSVALSDSELLDLHWSRR
jgi:uncharacterized protein YbaR (Trm112 family)